MDKMFVPNFIVNCVWHLEKNYFFSSGVPFLISSFFISALGTSDLSSEVFGLSAVFSSTTGAKFSSVTSSGFDSTSIPIFFFIFSVILADFPVRSLK